MDAHTLTIPPDAHAFVVPATPLQESDFLAAVELDRRLENVRTAKALGLFDDPDVQEALTEYECLLLRLI